jgi:hypothetical protein
MIERFGMKLAHLAHRAAIEEVAEIQQRTVLRYSIGALHGGRSLPLSPVMRRMSTGGPALADAPSRLALESEADAARLDDLYAIIEMLEEGFAAHRAQDAAAFGLWMAGRMAEAREPDRKGTAP